ncbi:MAG: prepilin-type N-terminal cleavage/methylation domain-containing protein [Candidatus Moraniibacteriota bacterium]
MEHKSKLKMKKTNKKQGRGFTLIESMVVLFIIGLLSAVAGIGYGTAARSKKIEQAARKITSELDATRDNAVFGQEIEDKYPCAYGIALSASHEGGLKSVYTSGTVSIGGDAVELTREGAMEKDLTCDELVDSAINGNQEVSFSYKTGDGLSFGNVDIYSIYHNLDPALLKCVVILFSAPRGAAYYYSDSFADCPSSTGGTGKFNLFTENTESLQPKDTNYFLTKLKITEGFVSSEGCHKTFPSGNGEQLGECP